MDHSDKEGQSGAHVPALLPQNTVIAKSDVFDVQKLDDLRQRGMNVTFIDIDILQVQETRALEARQQAHEHKLAEIRLQAQLREQTLSERHKRIMHVFRFTAEFLLKGLVFTAGFYLTSHGDQYSGNLLMGAVASTFARGFIEKYARTRPKDGN